MRARRVAAEELLVCFVFNRVTAAGDRRPTRRRTHRCRASAAKDDGAAVEPARAVGIGGAFDSTEGAGLSLADEGEAVAGGSARLPSAAFVAVCSSSARGTNAGARITELVERAAVVGSAEVDALPRFTCFLGGAISVFAATRSTRGSRGVADLIVRTMAVERAWTCGQTSIGGGVAEEASRAVGIGSARGH